MLRLALALAVRHEVLPRNPVDNVARLHRPARTPDALTAAEVNAIRAAIAYWEAGRSPSGPKPDGQLGVIVEVMLGTSARIGEVLAIRRRDIDITGAVPSIRIAGTIVGHRGESTVRQDHPKTAKSRRTVAIPSFTAEAVRRRLVKLEDPSLEALLFCSRERTPLTTNNVRRQLRHVMDLAGITGVTPHLFRRTVATAIKRAGWSRSRLRAARPHGPEDHDPALHPTQRDGEPGNRRDARAGVREGRVIFLCRRLRATLGR